MAYKSGRERDAEGRLDEDVGTGAEGRGADGCRAIGCDGDHGDGETYRQRGDPSGGGGSETSLDAVATAMRAGPSEQRRKPRIYWPVPRMKPVIRHHISTGLEYIGKWPLREISASSTPSSASRGR